MSTSGPADPAARPVPERPRRPPGTWRIGRVAGGDLLVTPSALLLVVMLAVLARPTLAPGQGPEVLGYLVGALYAVALYVAVLLHEVAHALAARRYGYRVHSITLRFLRGATSIDREARTPGQEVVVAVVGPLTSIAVGLAVLALQAPLAVGGTVQGVLWLLGWANVAIGVLNLVPGLPLDGGRVLKALVWRVTGDPYRGTAAAGWGGRVVAVLVLLWPLLRYLAGEPPSTTAWLVTLVIGVFLWTGASAAMTSARMRSRLPRLVARQLARRALGVPEDLSVAEAVRRARAEGAGSLVTVTAGGEPVGIVNEAAVVAVPERRRAWVPVASVARALEEGTRLPADLAGEDLVLAISRRPAEEYLLVEEDGSVLGVLTTADVDRAFREAD